MVLMIDNYDSFTYNLVQYFMQLGQEVKVYRNDEITIEHAEKIDFDYLVISPGPGKPINAGCSKSMIKAFAGKKPILGVCLGHQSIGEVFGCKITQAQSIMHGKSDVITHDGKSLYSGIPNPLKVIRYHSLAIQKDSIPETIEISAVSNDGEIMAIRHKELNIEGVQFHPESIGTEEGMKMLSNFINGTHEEFSIKDLLKKTISGASLSETEAGQIMEKITEGGITPAQIGSLLTSLTIKGPTVQELTGFAKVLYQKAKPVPLLEQINTTDTCGTGGDGIGTFNISTAAMFVACGAGVNIAKHGNRSITSKSGSADILETVGIKIDMSPEQAKEALKQTGMCFFFAPHYHPAFKNIMGPRRELGFRTIFNMIGPMLNPGKVKSQIMGVFSPDLTELTAEVLKNLGVHHAFVVHGSDGMDEITLTGKTKITELKDEWIRTWYFDPREYGFTYCSHEDIKGGDAEENAEIMKSVLNGEKGPRRDIVILNAAAAIVVSDITTDFKEAIQIASKSIDSKEAKKCFEKLVQFSSKL